jgi:hypothetical protein
MAQRRTQKYNPITRKYEWVTVDVPTDNKRLNTPKNPEHKQIVDWISQFDSTVSKSKRVNPDYAFLIRRVNGVDVTPAVLNDAKSAGIISDSDYRTRLKKYQDVRAEVGKSPMLDAEGKPVTYRNRVTNKEQPMMRSMWIQDGTYNYKQPFEEVANKASTKREALVKAQKDYVEPSHWGNTFSNLGATTRGTYNRKLAGDVATGVYKGVANAAFDTVGAAENQLNKVNQSVVDWGGSGNRITPQQFNMARASVVNALDPDQTDEELAAKVGDTISGNVDPRNVGQAAGMEAGNFLGALGVGLGSTALATALAGPAGVPVGVVNAGMLLGQIGGGIAEMATGDARYNPLGNPGGFTRKLAGAYGEPSEQATQMAHQQAYATGPLMMTAALTSALVTKKLPNILMSGNYKQNLKEAVNGVKTVQSAAKAQQTVNAIAEGAQGMGLPVATRPTIGQMAKDQLLKASPFAIESAANVAPQAVQAGMSLYDPEKTPMPEPVDVLTGLSFGVLSRAPKGTLPAKINNMSEVIARDSQIKYEATRQSRAARQTMASRAPIIGHLTKNVGMSYDEALAYVSHEFEQQYPGMRMPKSIDETIDVINALPSAQTLENNKATGRFTPVVNPEITERISSGTSLTGTSRPRTAPIGAPRQPIDLSRGSNNPQPNVDFTSTQVPEPPTSSVTRPTQPTSLVGQINPRLLKFSTVGQQVDLNLALKIARAEMPKPAITPESGA